MARAARLVVLLAAAALTASCSLTRLAYSNVAFAYSNAAPALAWMVGDYVEMSDGQKGFVRDRLLRAFAWHRTRELPEYRRFFERVALQAQDGFTVDEVRAAHHELRGYYHRTLERLLPDLADFLLQLDPEQLAQLERKLDKDNAKIVRESVEGTPAERGARRVKRYLENIGEFTGSLSEEQRKLVAAHASAAADFTDERLADRRYRQAEVLALMRAGPTRERTIAELRRLLIETESWRSADYLEKLRARDEKLFEMVAALSATLDQEQRAHLQKRLHGFVRDIAELTASN